MHGVFVIFLYTFKQQRTQVGLPGYSPSKAKLKKKNRFCRQNDIKCFMSFALQPKSATEIN
jgi:hypothetical protein